MTPSTDEDISDTIEAYKNYVYSLRTLETIVTQQSDISLYRQRMAAEGKKLETITEILPPIWHEHKCAPETREIFEERGKTGFIEGNFCAIFINSIFPNIQNAQLRGAYPDTNVLELRFNYPTPVQSAVLIYKNDAKLKDMAFLIDGKYMISYHGILGEEKISDVIGSSFLFNMQIEEAICAITKKISLEEQNIPYKNSDIWLETYASSHVKALEVNTLENQGKLVEYARKALQKRLNTPANITFDIAQREGLIPSSVRFQEYVDIRNLIHHHPDYYEQNDLLIKKNKNNEDVLKKMKESYARHYLKPLRQRIIQELEILSDIQILIEQIIPEIIVREKNESSNKFIKRIKEKLKTFSQTDICIDINFPKHSPNYKKIEKNIKKLFPHAALANECPKPYTDINEMCNITFCKTIIADCWSNLIKTINYYFITQGLKVEQNKTMKTLQQTRLLTPEEMLSLYKIREFRNKLSHNLLTADDIEKIKTQFASTTTKIEEIDKKIKENIPKGIVKEDTIEYTNKNGTVVVVKSDTLEIISVTNAKKTNRLYTKFPKKDRGR